MDRSKYAWNQDYRDGYDEGVKDGREQIKKQIEISLLNVSDEIKKIFSVFEDKESEDQRW